MFKRESSCTSDNRHCLDLHTNFHTSRMASFSNFRSSVLEKWHHKFDFFARHYDEMVINIFHIDKKTNKIFESLLFSTFCWTSGSSARGFARMRTTPSSYSRREQLCYFYEQMSKWRWPKQCSLKILIYLCISSACISQETIEMVLY